MNMKYKLIDYLNGTLHPDEEEKVGEWLLTHSHQKDVEAILDSFFDSVSTEGSGECETAYAMLSQKLHIKTSSRKSRYLSFIAVAVTMAIVSGLVCSRIAYKSGAEAQYKEMSGIAWTEVCVPDGQNRSIELSDGTLMELRPGTTMIYPDTFTGNERKVFIEGEVYAKVTKNSESPFVICSHETTVKVYGTTFNFKSYDNLDNVELMLFDGSLSFSIDSDKLTKTVNIVPGQVAQYDRKTGQFEISKFNKNVYREMCENNTLFYYNLSMQDIARDLEQRFNTKIVITGNSIAESRIFAMFTNNESLDEILSAISAGRKMKIEKNDNTIYLK